MNWEDTGRNNHIEFNTYFHTSIKNYASMNGQYIGRNDKAFSCDRFWKEIL